MGLKLGGIVVAAGLAAGATTGSALLWDRFREANSLARAGDYPKAIARYGEVAAGGGESASLYWNWAQVAGARGATGEALWALLRARELDPGDRALAREIERRRESSNLDPAEIAPDPLAAWARLCRRYHLDLAAVFLIGLSVLLHAAARVRGAGGLAAASIFALGLLLMTGAGAAAWARSGAVVVGRGAPLLDAASASAETLGTLREGEVVPILEASGDYLRVEDSSGARGWALTRDVWRLDRPTVPSR